MAHSRMRAYVPVIRRFVLQLLVYHASVAARLGLNATDVSSLRLLGEQPLSAGALSELVGLTGAATTALIDRLEQAGFVSRERSTDDRRRITVLANQSKLREINTLYLGQGEKMAKLLGSYSAKDFHVVLDFLEKTAKILSEEAKMIREKS